MKLQRDQRRRRREMMHTNLRVFFSYGAAVAYGKVRMGDLYSDRTG